MGCAASAPALADDLTPIEHPLVEGCVAKVETVIGIDNFNDWDAVPEYGDDGSLKPKAVAVLKVSASLGAELFQLHVAPWSSTKLRTLDTHKSGDARGPTVLVAPDGNTVVGAFCSLQEKPPSLSDHRSMVAYSTTPLFEGQNGVTVRLHNPNILYPQYINGNEHVMYPRVKLTAAPHQELMCDVHVATADGFQSERAYRLVYETMRGGLGSGFRDVNNFFLNNKDFQRVALPGGAAAPASGEMAQGQQHVSVAQGMDMSLVPVILWMSSKLHDETVSALQASQDLRR